MELDISTLFNSPDFAPRDYSASVAEIGADAGPATWRAACDDSQTYMLLDDEDKREAFREHIRGFGAWEDDEIASWSDLELNALCLQMISGDIRESALDGEPGVDENTPEAWERYQRHSDAGIVCGRMFRADDGRIYYYLRAYAHNAQASNGHHARMGDRLMETRDGYPVVCVKFYGSQLPEGGTESQRELAYDRAREDWWNDATEKAKELGFSDVYALGRSGGWIAPHYNRRAPDLDDKRERKAFQAFAAWVRGEMEPTGLADRFQSYLDDEIDSTPEAVPAPPLSECERFLGYCENRADRAAASSDREFWRRLAGSVRKAATML